MEWSRYTSSKLIDKDILANSTAEDFHQTNEGIAVNGRSQGNAITKNKIKSGTTGDNARENAVGGYK